MLSAIFRLLVCCCLVVGGLGFCGTYEYYCTLDRCIGATWVCDGSKDCEYGDDESADNCRDDVYPRFDLCPDDITVVTNPGTNYQTARWREPRARDNKGIKYRGKSDSPGNRFYLRNGNSTAHNVRYWATDYAGNTAYCTFKVIVMDKEPPKLECPQETSNYYKMEYGFMLISIDDGSPNATITWTVNATDNSGVSHITSFPYQSGDVFPIRLFPPYETTIRASDPTGNTDECILRFAVVDTESPVVNCPTRVNSYNFVVRTSHSSWTVFSDTDSTPVQLYWSPASATDNSGTIVSVSSNYHPGDVFPVSNVAYQITYTATDDAGNVGNCSIFITVEDDRDSGSSVNSERVCNSREFQCENQDCIPISLQCDGNTDCSDESDEKVEICQPDLELPEFVGCPNDITVNTDPGTNYKQVSWRHPEAYDNRGIKYRGASHWPDWNYYLVDGNSTVYTVRYWADDYSGNTGECVFTITVIDNEPPKQVCPKNISNFYKMENGVILISTEEGSPNATITWAEDATDNSGMPHVTSFPYKSGDVFPIRSFPPYETTVRATDPTGNTDDCILQFAVIDTESPVVTCPTQSNNVVSRESNSSWTVFSKGSIHVPVQLYWSPANATDNSGTAVNVSSNYRPGDGFPVSNVPHQITYTAVDEAGNVGNCSFFIKVKARIYHGCFDDITWTSAVPKYENLTIDWCTQHCYDLSYPYAGLQGGVFCQCMGIYLEFYRRPEHECNTVCSGKPQEICGGAWRKSIYYTERVCNSIEFQCDNQECIPISLQCDGNADCSDGSDETFEICLKKPCRGNQFDCGKGRICIPLNWYCNGNNDCEDGLDEATCDSPQLNGCPDDFTVGTSQGRNYTEVWWTEPSLSSNTSIRIREQSNSPGDRFEIKDGKSTVHTVRYWVQDVYRSEAQCLFNITVFPRTYLGCFQDTSWTEAVPRHDDLTIDWCIQHCYDLHYAYAGLQYGVYCRCMDEYTTGSPYYKRPETECNKDCGGNAKEICGGNWRKSVYTTETICNRAEFQCDNDECIPVSLQCDANTDCSDGSDENVEMCQTRPCREKQFDCGIGSICLPLALYCNGNNDCEDGLDESTCDYPQLYYCPDDIVVDTDSGKNYSDVWWSSPWPSSVTTIKARKQSHTPIHRFEMKDGKPTVYTLRYWVQDVYLKEAECLFNVTVIDNESPVVNCPSQSSNFASRESNSAWSVSTDRGSIFAQLYWPPANATDNSGIVVSVTSNYSPGDVFRLSNVAYQITYTAIDVAGNVGNCSFFITVEDLESPSVECPSHIETTSALVSWDIMISDNVAVVHYFSNDTRVKTNSLLNGKSFTLAQSGTFPVGTTFIEYLVTDLAWNKGKCVIKITVEDVEPPNITCPDKHHKLLRYIL
ncbi:hyalin-like isoform X2 [Anneissia japonica]|uniref:hyalin-like isoform X2 n=1 Tax=Anneissia japonica TaxID=1529436 RepID=UPI0014259134|nr:hyalin-like isoform X2 [Anneissia japonica]